MSVYGGYNDTIASNYSQVACAHSLQIISDALHSLKVCTLSIALDSSTHQSHSYIDVRARFMVKNTIYNLYLLANPLFQSHTGENKFATTYKFIDALYLLWKETLIAVSSNGYRLMKGRTQGLLTRIDRVTSHGMIRVWCGLHHLDLVMQRVYKKSLDNEFMGILTSLIGHIFRQHNLIQDMQSTCPKVATMR